MARPLVIFEDDLFCQFYPLTLTRPVFELVCGILSLKDKIKLGMEAWARTEDPGFSELLGGQGPDLRFHVREYLEGGYPPAAGSYLELGAEVVTFINARLLLSHELLEGIDPLWPGKYTWGPTVVWANVPAAGLAAIDRHRGKPLAPEAFANLPSHQIKARLVAYPWELVGINGEEIERDFGLLGGPAPDVSPAPGIHLAGQDRMRIGPGVRLSPGVVIDATGGPVSIEDEVTVMANASLQGPLHIGHGSTIKMGATIYGQTTIGPVCKVGGEVAETIIQGYTNKQHGGFLGHSYLGEWVNLGAGTDTSDMKNNYSAVRVSVGGKMVDSGETFVGLFMGDHSKSGIGTVFNAGSMVGVCCNVFGADYPPKWIPSFAWGGSSGLAEHDPDKAIETARRAMARRGRALTSWGEAALREIYRITADERRHLPTR
jgi:UDP-N-acetylglucosamine diphosphorylase/glucosamine-1-phosphate N-acetyltransferase